MFTNLQIRKNLTFCLLLLFSISCFGQKSYPKEENLNFTKKYIHKNKGKFIVEIPEVHELGNILVALTNVGKIDSNMVNMETAYYKKVIEHFKAFENHAIMDTLNKYIHTPLEKNSYYYYFTIKMDACAFEFKGDKLVNQGNIKKLSWPFYNNPFDEHRELIEDFAKKSNFRKFYKSNKNHYKTLITTYRELNPVDQMQHWLQSKFKKEYGSYKAVFSELVGGSHAANNYEDNGFDHRFMFIASSSYDKSISKTKNILIESRVLFTEIDHHFVNPISEFYRNELDEVFGIHRNNWINDKISGTESYPNGYSVFNEYMTWALFIIYANDFYDAAEVASYEKDLVRKMINRGFYKFEDFNAELVKKYNENKAIDMKVLIKHMMDWSKAKNI